MRPRANATDDIARQMRTGQIKTGATGSPYAVAGLTGAAWAWSAWTACALPTDGTDQVARLTFEAKTTAGTVYVAAVVVEGVAP